MKISSLLLFVAVGAQAVTANALTYTITDGAFSTKSGATTVDFGVSQINNIAATSGSLPTGYTGGALYNPSTSGIGGIAARPAGGAENFWSFGSGKSGTVDFGTPLSYYGFLWGSPDSYNTVKFYNGTSLLGAYDGSVLRLSNAWANSGYFNVYAAPGEQITRIVFSSAGNAFETDNHAYVGAIPEPEYFALLTLGLVVVGVSARRKSLMAARLQHFAI